jgi:hypothetical protein
MLMDAKLHTTSPMASTHMTGAPSSLLHALQVATTGMVSPQKVLNQQCSCWSVSALGTALALQLMIEGASWQAPAALQSTTRPKASYVLLHS